MVLTNIKNFKRYQNLNPAFKIVAKCLKSRDILESDPGRIVIDGDNFFINVAHTHGVAKDSQMLELHKDYLDIHVLVEGRETIGYKAIGDIESYSQKYNKSTDCAFSSEPADSFVTLGVGDICILYPEDAHAPLIGNGVIKKLVFKIKLSTSK